MSRHRAAVLALTATCTLWWIAESFNPTWGRLDSLMPIYFISLVVPVVALVVWAIGRVKTGRFDWPAGASIVVALIATVMGVGRVVSAAVGRLM